MKLPFIVVIITTAATLALARPALMSRVVEAHNKIPKGPVVPPAIPSRKPEMVPPMTRREALVLPVIEPPPPLRKPGMVQFMTREVADQNKMPQLPLVVPSAPSRQPELLPPMTRREAIIPPLPDPRPPLRQPGMMQAMLHEEADRSEAPAERESLEAARGAGPFKPRLPALQQW